jgi:flavin-dependent dehydrogenase
LTASAQIVVVGRGPAGAACALALARAGVDGVCLAGRSDPFADRAAVGESIPPDARVLLDRLGLWQAFLDEGHERCLGSCSTWGSDIPGYNDYLLNPQGCGWHLDRRRFDAFLCRQAQAAGVATIAEGEGDAVTSARFVVDATGRSSAVARRHGARQVALDRLTFVHGFFDLPPATVHSRLTLLEAVRDGWWYAAVIPGRRVAVAFAGDAEHVRESGLAHAQPWLRAALGTRLLAASLEGARFVGGSLVSRVVSSFVLDRACGPRWLAVGDAASCFDPLAAQGIYKAIDDGIAGAQAIVSALATGGDLDPGYEQVVRGRFEEYLVNRNHFYGLERRWPDAPFWRRRHARTELGALS